MQILEQYLAEAQKDMEVDEIKLKDKTMMVVAIKHKWAARLVLEKIKHKKLENERKAKIEALATQLQSVAPVSYTPGVLKEAIAKSDPIKNLNEQLEESEILIEYLEKVDKIMTGMGYDLKNLIEVIKMETM